MTMDDKIRRVLGTWPVLDAAYRARLESVGCDPDAQELNPPSGSIQVTCETCGAGAWLSPEQQTMWTGRGDLEIMCLLCCWLLAKTAEDADIPVAMIGLNPNQ